MKLTVTVITRDEAANIAAALQSVAWADEIIVVDSHSTDETASIARALATRVEIREWPGYSAQKNYAASLASHDWILSLDADERVTPELAEEIRELLRKGPAECGYRIPRVTWYLGRWIRSTDWYPDYQLRLYDRRSSRWNGRRVHESVESDRPPGRLRHELQHYAYRDLSHHLATIDTYTSLAAEQWLSEGRRTGAVEMFFHPRFAFIRNYLLRGGFRDGAAGLLVSRMNAYYVFLKFAKLWELQQAANTPRSGADNQQSPLPDPQSSIRNPQSSLAKSAVANRQSPIDKG
ncbi:MAG: glycosyltransferase family 2 protein [Vicinamibacterales bacterium]